MNRRDLLIGGATAASIVAIETAPLNANGNVIYKKADALVSGRRISCVKDDPGEILYGECCADGRKIKVLLDGVEAQDCVTADEGLGIIVRAMSSPNGNLLVNFNTGEFLHETVRGKVVIEIGEPTK